MDSVYTIIRLSGNDVRLGDERYINILRTELHTTTPLPVTYKELKDFAQENRLVVARDITGTIAGMASAFVVRDFSGKMGHIDEVIVGEKYRGQGIADALMNLLEEIARQEGLVSLHLTSSDKREAAHHLYVKHGFVKGNPTNHFYKKL